MPTYEYECSACRRRFEIWQAISDRPLRKCTACGKLTVRRLISAGAGLLFKGSGFYITDYRKPSYKARAEAERKAISKPAGSDAKSTTASPKKSG